MVARLGVVATARQIAELRLLARWVRRDEADRVRVILSSLEGPTSARLASAFGVGADSVRRWHVRLAQGGTDELPAAAPPG